MARSEARIFTTIWQDVQFLVLSEGAQRLYLFLLSQPDLSHCGLIALRERRWARSAAGLTVDRVTAALKELDAARFVVIDEDTEEVLIRSLIRRDQIWKQPNVMKSAREAAQLIESPHLRASLLEELRRIPSEEASELARRVLADFMGDLAKGSGNPSSNPSGNPSVEPSADPSGAPSQGKGEGYGGKVEASPLPGIPSPLPPSAATAPPRRDPAKPINAGDVIAAYMDGAKEAKLPPPAESLRSRVGKQARALLADKNTDHEALLVAARNMGAGGWQDLAVQMQRDAAAARDSPSNGKYAPGSDPHLKPSTTPIDPTKVI
ncbi:hypothetical protein ACIBQ1_09625 [Nonomuraea sp. NPDC050153]|uniref:hypothetical protein n=1 Tax=Nonomuraea sp. NPDC050153 TaxID=3364359 RepID=UPI0037919D9B